MEGDPAESLTQTRSRYRTIENSNNEDVMLEHDTKQFSCSSMIEAKRRELNYTERCLLRFFAGKSEQQRQKGKEKEKNQSHNKSPQMILKWMEKKKIHRDGEIN